MKKATLSLLILISSILIVHGQVKDTILIDLGNTANLTPLPWNNITNVSTGHIPDLINSYGFSSGMGIRVVDRFNTTSAYGTSAPAPGIGIPASASVDYFFGNTSEFGNMTLPTASVIIEGLDPNQAYTLQLFASRLHSNNLQTLYVIRGTTTDSLLAIYGNYAIDFWNGLADQNGWIPAIYNSGDGIHLNNAGHRELFHRVWQHTIDTPGCAPFIGIVHHTKKPAPLGFNIYPNPATEHITIDMLNTPFARGHIVVYDIFGKIVHQQNVANPTGGDLVTIPVSHLANGVYLVVLATDNLRYTHRFCKTNSATRF